MKGDTYAAESGEILAVVQKVLRSRWPEAPSLPWLVGPLATLRRRTTRFNSNMWAEPLDDKEPEVVVVTDDYAQVRIGARYRERYVLQSGFSGEHEVMIDEMQLRRTPEGWRVSSLKVDGLDVTEHAYMDVTAKSQSRSLLVEVRAAEETQRSLILYCCLSNLGSRALHLNRLAMRRSDGDRRFGYIGTQAKLAPREETEDILYSSLPLTGRSRRVLLTLFADPFFLRRHVVEIDLGSPIRIRFEQEFGR